MYAIGPGTDILGAVTLLLAGGSFLVLIIPLCGVSDSLHSQRVQRHPLPIIRVLIDSGTIYRRFRRMCYVCCTVVVIIATTLYFTGMFGILYPPQTYLAGVWGVTYAAPLFPPFLVATYSICSQVLFRHPLHGFSI